MTVSYAAAVHYLDKTGGGVTQKMVEQLRSVGERRMSRWVRDMQGNLINLDQVIWIEVREFFQKGVTGTAAVAHLPGDVHCQLVGKKGDFFDDDGYEVFSLSQWLESQSFEL